MPDPNPYIIDTDSIIIRNGFFYLSNTYNAQSTNRIVAVGPAGAITYADTLLNISTYGVGYLPDVFSTLNGQLSNLSSTIYNGGIQEPDFSAACLSLSTTTNNLSNWTAGQVSTLSIGISAVESLFYSTVYASSVTSVQLVSTGDSLQTQIYVNSTGTANQISTTIAYMSTNPFGYAYSSAVNALSTYVYGSLTQSISTISQDLNATASTQGIEISTLAGGFRTLSSLVGFSTLSSQITSTNQQLSSLSSYVNDIAASTAYNTVLIQNLSTSLSTTNAAVSTLTSSITGGYATGNDISTISSALSSYATVANICTISGSLSSYATIANICTISAGFANVPTGNDISTLSSALSSYATVLALSNVSVTQQLYVPLANLSSLFTSSLTTNNFAVRNQFAVSSFYVNGNSNTLGGTNPAFDQVGAFRIKTAQPQAFWLENTNNQPCEFVFKNTGQLFVYAFGSQNTSRGMFFWTGYGDALNADSNRNVAVALGSTNTSYKFYVNGNAYIPALVTSSISANVLNVGVLNATNIVGSVTGNNLSTLSSALSSYATIANICTISSALSSYATIANICTISSALSSYVTTAQFSSLSGGIRTVYATGASVSTLSASLSSYATVANICTISSALSSYATVANICTISSALSSYATVGNICTISSALSSYATVANICTISGSLSSYATVANICTISGSLSSYATGNDVSTISSALSSYATVANICTISGSLSSYATVANICTISGSLSSYATGNDVSTISSALSSYATVANICTISGSLSSYATLANICTISSALSSYATVANICTISGSLSSYATLANICTISSALSSYATLANICTISSALSSYATVANICTISGSLSSYLGFSNLSSLTVSSLSGTGATTFSSLTTSSLTVGATTTLSSLVVRGQLTCSTLSTTFVYLNNPALSTLMYISGNINTIAGIDPVVDVIGAMRIKTQNNQNFWLEASTGTEVVYKLTDVPGVMANGFQTLNSRGYYIFTGTGDAINADVNRNVAIDVGSTNISYKLFVNGAAYATSLTAPTGIVSSLTTSTATMNVISTTTLNTTGNAVVQGTATIFNNTIISTGTFSVRRATNPQATITNGGSGAASATSVELVVTNNNVVSAFGSQVDPRGTYIFVNGGDAVNIYHGNRQFNTSGSLTTAGAYMGFRTAASTFRFVESGLSNSFVRAKYTASGSTDTLVASTTAVMFDSINIPTVNAWMPGTYQLITAANATLATTAAGTLIAAQNFTLTSNDWNYQSVIPFYIAFRGGLNMSFSTATVAAPIRWYATYENFTRGSGARFMKGAEHFTEGKYVTTYFNMYSISAGVDSEKARIGDNISIRYYAQDYLASGIKVLSTPTQFNVFISPVVA
jgi:hypothetical protein